MDFPIENILRLRLIFALNGLFIQLVFWSNLPNLFLYKILA